ncbi:MAG TPA: N-acetylmuramoyl-L-alanine amidase [Desulfosporosinus sp.]|nr:N-acetylmuramoyl-L-alanine amidase [Desulfosporosinus sp.]
MKVCLDPGHGGSDPGAVGNGLLEKNLTLAICLALKPLLENNGISVILTRDGDYAPEHIEGTMKEQLKARVAIAEKNKVDLFVAVHINAGGGTGQEILIIGKGGQAEKAANRVLPFLVSAGSWANRGVKTQNVLVLRETSMPAILTENGFIDHAMDSEKLKDPSFRYALAVAHAKGLCAYFGIQYKTPILGKETVTLEQCQQFMLKKNPQALDIIPFYKIKGELLGIRWGYALAQMMKETGYLKFGGDVLPSQYNFAGIGAIGGGAPGATFSTPEEGVLAHLEHLYAYASADPLPVGISKVDPRFDLVLRASCPNWEDLNGHWAVPGIHYGEDIVAIYKGIAAEVVKPLQDAGVALFIDNLMEYIKDYSKNN